MLCLHWHFSICQIFKPLSQFFMVYLISVNFSAFRVLQEWVIKPEISSIFLHCLYPHLKVGDFCFCKTIPELRSVVNTRLRDFPVFFYDIEYDNTLVNFEACVCLKKERQLLRSSLMGHSCIRLGPAALYCVSSSVSLLLFMTPRLLSCQVKAQ